MVILKEVNDKNFYKLVKMQTQEHVAPNVFSIAQAYLFPEVKPRAVYNEERELVGFVMYGPEPDQNDQIWIWRLSIDVPFQRKGYGRATVKKVIENHQGKIKINSKVGQGTEAIIILPGVTKE